MKFIRYPKVHRLGKEETDGILYGQVHVEEKIDGANAQIWIDDGKISVGSRNNTLCTDVDNPIEGNNMFNGFVEHVANSENIKKLLFENPEMRLYGEWLVRHTIHYNETNYSKFYLFDIKVGKEFLTKEKVRQLGEVYNIPMPEYHGVFTNPTQEQLMEYVGKSALGDNGEGVVLRNFDFVNPFGDMSYAKIVTPKFQEDNSVVFGGNNKHSPHYWEQHVVVKYMTLARVKKIMQKTESQIDERLDLKHTPRIANTAYHDMLTEEIWEIQKKVESLNFKVLKRIAMKKAVQIYKDVLLGTTSIADNE